jgi:hypothetical protein
MRVNTRDWEVIARFRMLAPPVLRTLIYRTLLGFKGFNGISGIVENELLGHAGLTEGARTNPTYHGLVFCVHCKRGGATNLGTTTPLQVGCVHCGYIYNIYKGKYPMPFWYRFQDWPTEFQKECLQYLFDQTN